MTKTALHPLFESLHNINAGRETQDDDRCLFSLRYVEEVIEEGLTRVGREEIEFIEYEDDGLGSFISPIFRYL